MNELARLDTRVTILEQHMPEIRKLAADASSEVGDVHTRLRAHTKSLEALRGTQLEMLGIQVDHGRKIEDLRETQLEQGDEMRARFAAVDERFESMDERFESMDQRFESMDQRFESIDERFGCLETEMRAGFATMDQRFGSLRSEMRAGFATMGVGMAQITKLIQVAIDKSGEP